MLLTSLGAALALQLALGQQADWDPRDAGPDTIDVSSYPEAQRKQYPLFRVKCSKCHPVSRPINSQYQSSEWKRYMKRMIRRPNSGINEEQAQGLYEFLKYFSSAADPKGASDGR